MQYLSPLLNILQRTAAAFQLQALSSANLLTGGVRDYAFSISPVQSWRWSGCQGRPDSYITQGSHFCCQWFCCSVTFSISGLLVDVRNAQVTRGSLRLCFCSRQSSSFQGEDLHWSWQVNHTTFPRLAHSSSTSSRLRTSSIIIRHPPQHHVQGSNSIAL